MVGKKEKSRTVRIALLGPSGVGKTQICTRFVNNSFEWIYEPTKDVRPFKKVVNLTQDEQHKRYCQLLIEDLFPIDDPDLQVSEDGTQNEKSHYFDCVLENKWDKDKDNQKKQPGITAYLYVFDASDLSTLDELEGVMEYIRAREEKEAGRRKAQSAFKMLIGNKADLDPTGLTKRKIDEYNRKYQTAFKMVSALDNQGIDDIFFEAALTSVDTNAAMEGLDEEEGSMGFWASCCGSRDNGESSRSVSVFRTVNGDRIRPFGLKLSNNQNMVIQASLIAITLTLINVESLCPSLILNCKDCGIAATTCDVCNDGFWWDGTDCSPCVEPCATCDGGTKNDCLTCNGANTEIPASPKTCVCIDTFVNIGTGDEVNCQCPSDSTSNGTECLCNATFYDSNASANNVNCTSCIANCDVCSNGTSCTECTSTFFLNNSGSECIKPCPDGNYGDNTYPASCQPCVEPCATCDGGTSNDCLTCNGANTTIASAPGACICIDTFINIGTGAQVDCDCPSDSTSNGTECICNTKFYDSNSSASVVSCLDCIANCDDCADGSTCQACTATYYLDNSNTSCVSACPGGKYKDNTAPASCQPCVEPCATCDGGTSNDCLSCNGSNTTMPSTPGTCVCIDTFENIGTGSEVNCDCPSDSTSNGTECLCDQFFYDSDTSASVVNCSNCPNFCLTCSDSSTCTLCDVGYFIAADGSCVNPCPVQYWENTTSPASCQPCVEPCNTCDGGTSNDCLSCNGSNTTMPSTPGTCVCIDTFENIGTGSEVNCDCPSDSTSNGTECLCDITFLDVDASASVVDCQSCPSDCDTCSDVNTCTLCSSGFYINFESKCKNPCEDGYWEDNTAPASCQPCVEPCQTCDGGTSNDCLSCNNVNAEVDTPSPNTCVCKSTYILNSVLPLVECECPGDSTDKGGYCECDVTFYDADTDPDALDCQKCPDNCDECSSDTICTKCSATYYLHQSSGGCVLTCDPKYWADATDPASCQPCVDPCNECTGGTATDCTTCNGLNAFVNGSNTCECNSTFENDFTYPEVSCSCPLNSAPKTGTCQCKDNYLDTDGSANVVFCEQCPSNCKKCSATTTCTECFSGYHLHQSNGQCVTTCDGGYYATGTPSQCTPCFGPPCATCYAGGATSCLTCSGSNTQVSGGVCSCKPSYENKVTLPDVNCDCPPSSTAVSDVCTCNPGYIDTDSSPVTFCENCPNDCTTCSDTSTCTHCDATFYLHQSGGNCVSTCDNEFYGDDSLAHPKCLACNEPCKNCDGGTINDCLSCNGNNTQLASGPSSTCICIDTFENIATPPEVDCRCPSHSSDNAGTCECDSGYVDTDLSAQTVVCAKCTDHCDTCQAADPNTCTQCLPGYYLHQTDGTCASLCEDGYYEDTSSTPNSCQQCHDTCKTCDGSSQNDCITCYGNAKPQGFGGGVVKCQCKDPFIDDAAPGQNCVCPDNSTQVGSDCLCDDGFADDDPTAVMDCQPCQGNCQICTQVDYCTLCDNTWYLHQSDGSCTQTCDIGYYKNDDPPPQCEICVSYCSTCTNSSECVECLAGFYLQPVTNLCNSQCPNFYFKDSSLNPDACNDCVSDCKICVNGTACQQCDTGFFLQPTTNLCDSSCPDEYYEDTSSVPHKCSSCISNCKTCTDSTACQECNATYYLQPTTNACNTTCPTRYFQDAGPPAICTACPSNCEVCSDASTCTKCDATYFIQPDDSCATTCPDNYYEDTSTATHVCTACITDCKVCDDQVDCDECTAGNYLQPTTNTCSSTCPDGYYTDNAATPNKCTLCHAMCNKCNGGNYNNCTECTIAHTSLTTNPGPCVCDVTYYNANSVTNIDCQSCISNCDTCSNSTECTTCTNPYTLSPAKTCGVGCPSGYFENASGACEKCNTNCKECSGSNYNQCTECSDSNATPSSSPGQCVCNNRFYNSASGNNTNCKDCLSDCFSCTNKNDCTQCESGLALINSTNPMQCVNSCPDGFYLEISPIFQCKPCHPTCQQCVGNDIAHCSECWDSVAYIVDSVGKCLCRDPFTNSDTVFLQQYCKCPDNSYRDGEECFCDNGYYDQDKDKYAISCLQCPTYCSNRGCLLDNNNVIICNCIGDQAYDESTKSCVDKCPDDQWKNYNLRKCVDCEFPCQTCKDSTYQQCSSCFIDGMELTKDFQCQCKSTYILKDGKCVCPAQSTEIDSKCQCNKSYYSVFNNGDMSCLSCKENCISCESVDNTVICLSCGAGFTLKDKTCNQILLYLRIDKVIDNVIYFTVFNLNWMILQNLNIGLSIDGNVITVFNVLPSTGGRLLQTPEEFISEDQYELHTQIHPIIGNIKLDLFELQVASGLFATYVVDPNDVQSKDEEDDDQEQAEFEEGLMYFLEVIVLLWYLNGLYTNNLSGFWYFLSNIQLLGFIPLTAVKLPQTAVIVLRVLLKYIIIPNIFELFIEEEGEAYNEYADRNDFTTRQILRNAGSLLILLFLLIFAYPLLLLASKKLNFAKRLVQQYKWNSFIRYQFLAFLQFLILGLIQVLEFDFDSTNLLINQICGIILTASCVTTPLWLMYLYAKTVKQYRDGKVAGDYLIYFPKIETLYYEFKSKTSLKKLLFYAWFIIRRVLYSLNWLFNSEMGDIQAALNLVLAVMNLAIICQQMPYKVKYYSMFILIIEMLMVCLFGIVLLAQVVDNEIVITVMVITGVVLIILCHATHFIITKIALKKRKQKQLDIIPSQIGSTEEQRFVQQAQPPLILLEKSNGVNDNYKLNDTISKGKNSVDEDDFANTERPSSYFNAGSITKPFNQ